MWAEGASAARAAAEACAAVFGRAQLPEVRALVRAYLGCPVACSSVFPVDRNGRHVIVKGAPHQMAVGRLSVGDRRSKRGYMLYDWTVLERSDEGAWIPLAEAFPAEIDPAFQSRSGCRHPVAFLQDRSLAIFYDGSWQILDAPDLVIDQHCVLVEPDGAHLLWAPGADDSRPSDSLPAAFESCERFSCAVAEAGTGAGDIGASEDAPGRHRVIFGRCSIGEPGSAPVLGRPQFYVFHVPKSPHCAPDVAWNLARVCCICWDWSGAPVNSGAVHGWRATLVGPGGSDQDPRLCPRPAGAVLLVQRARKADDRAAAADVLLRANFATGRCTALHRLAYWVYSIETASVLPGAVVIAGAHPGRSGAIGLVNVRSGAFEQDVALTRCYPFEVTTDPVERCVIFDKTMAGGVGRVALPDHLFAPPPCHPACACHVRTTAIEPLGGAPGAATPAASSASAHA